MPESSLWALDDEGRVITLSTWKCTWSQVKGKGSKINHFKRISSATWCLWAIGCDHQPYLLVHSSDVKIRYQEVLYENERRKLIRSYSSRYLKASDPCHMHHENSKLLTTKELLRLPSSRWIWEDDWHIQETINGELTDKGWQYAPNFHSEFTSHDSMNCFVRRRKWIRFRRFSALDRWLLLPLDENHPSRAPLLDLCVGGEMMAHQKDGFLSLWAVNLNGELLYRKGVHRICPEGSGWVTVEGPSDEFILSVSVGCTGSVWICTDQGSLYVRTGVSWHCPLGNGWLFVEAPESLLNETIVCVSVGVYAVWAVANTGRYWYRREVNSYIPAAIGGTRWTPMVGKLRNISVGPEDQAWAIDLEFCQLLHRTGVTPGSGSGKVWRYVDLPLVIRTPSRSSSSSQDTSHFSLSVEEVKSLQKNVNNLIEERNPYNVEAREPAKLSKNEENSNARFYSIFNDYPVDSICYNHSQEKLMDNPFDSIIPEESETSLESSHNDEIKSDLEIYPVEECLENNQEKEENAPFYEPLHDSTPQILIPNGNNSTNIHVDEDEEEVFVESSQPQCTLRWICASSLYLDEGQSIQKWLAASRACRYEEGGSLSSNTQNTTINRNDSNKQDTSHQSKSQTIDKCFWRKEIIEKLVNRNDNEYKNREYFSYDLAIKQTSWRENVKCQVILGTDTAADDFEKTPRFWLDSEFFLEQWKCRASCDDISSVDGFLKLEYKHKKKLLCEVQPVLNVSCFARVPLIEASNSIIQCLAIYIKAFSHNQQTEDCEPCDQKEESTLSSKSCDDLSEPDCGTSLKSSQSNESGQTSDNAAKEEVEVDVEFSETLPSVQNEAEMICRQKSQPENVLWLIRLNSEEEVNNWLRILSNLFREQSKQQRYDNLDLNSHPSTGWVISGATDAFKTSYPSNIKGDHTNYELNKTFWQHVPGHFRCVESGALGSTVTWAIGHNGVAWVFLNEESFIGGSLRLTTVQKDSRILDVFEHQRARFFSSTIFDDYMWGDEFGQISRTREQVVLTSSNHSWSRKSDWTIDFTVKGGCDAEGWQYSRDQNNYEGKQRWNYYFRRRRWVREYQVSSLAPWKEVVSTERIQDVSIKSFSNESTVNGSQSQSSEVDVWAVSSQGVILRRKGVTAEKPEGTNWVQILGEQCFQSVSISSEDQLWAIGEDGSAWLRRGISPNSEGSSWAHVGAPDNSSLVQISAGDGWIVWSVDSRGRLWSRKNAQPVLPEGTDWVSVPLPYHGAFVSRVSCGSGKVWIVCKSNHCLYERHNVSQENPAGDMWSAALKGLVYCASVRGVLPSQQQSMDSF